ncbi:uncharacterized protein EI90DRAFT_3066164 [Cantharellus anzutake]|uniref:uncharacterized protein n=1 Tax=Cantharellus anzutake TaxID=1750568 RepID=UPI001905B119|nr:uncharacterized protein EI90DRAFT_3066164 [Cantharellus anzutake]KAF8327878.1 hypothetical protein EI90DRAFT_3066164 [Cantharellus anzutake]
MADNPQGNGHRISSAKPFTADSTFTRKVAVATLVKGALISLTHAEPIKSFKTLIKKGAEMIKEREMRLMTLEAIHKVWNEEERKALEQLRKLGLPVNTKPGRGKRIDGWRREATSTWKRITADCRSLKKQIKVLQGEILEIRDIVRSQTNGKTTGYKGISDWAKDALDDYSENIRILSALSILGAGISYTSIVSALRGNISYMCISFVLFLGCLMVATTLQVVLVWCSRQGNYPFPNPTFWYTIVTIVVVLARLSMAIAMAFLLTSVQVLGRNPDAPPTFTSSPRVCMIATYVVLGGAFTAFSCFTSVFKHKVLTWGRSNEHFSVKVKMLEDLD